MSDEKKKTFALGDDSIAIIRELVQLSILTGTNIIDHFRALQLTEDEDGKLVPTDAYIQSYNDHIEELSAQAESLRQQASETRADDALDPAPDFNNPEFSLYKDPETLN